MAGQPPYTDEELLQVLRDLAERLGETPTSADVRDDEQSPALSTYTRRFGSWNRALSLADLEQHQPDYSRSELVRHIRELAAEIGRVPTYEDMNAADDRPSLQPYETEFGTWNDAIEAAGLEPRASR